MTTIIHIHTLDNISVLWGSTFIHTEFLEISYSLIFTVFKVRFQWTAFVDLEMMTDGITPKTLDTRTTNFSVQDGMIMHVGLAPKWVIKGNLQRIWWDFHENFNVENACVFLTYEIPVKFSILNAHFGHRWQTIGHDPYAGEGEKEDRAKKEAKKIGKFVVHGRV